MRRSLVLAALFTVPILGCSSSDESTTPTAPRAIALAKGNTTAPVPYVLRFSGDVASGEIVALLNPADPLRMAEVDLRGTSSFMSLPTSETVLQGTNCANTQPAVPNTWGAYGGVSPNMSDWQGRFWLDRPTGKSIRLYFGLYQTMQSTNTAGSPGAPAILEFVVTSGVETKTKDALGRTHSTVRFTNQRAFTTGPGLSFDNSDRCVTLFVTATPR